MGAIVQRMLFTSTCDKPETNGALHEESILKHKVTTIDGEERLLGDFCKNMKVIIIVNVASK